MSTEVEQRVLQMKFDNAKFEAGVQSTLNTLANLKKSLNFDGVGKGFNNITSAANNVDLNTLGNATESLSVKFDGLQVFAITAFSRISNSAITAGKNLISAFTIDPIKTGFQEYETQMNAVQTILANTKNKGSTLADVNAALAELNTYSDKTIYNFTEMTRNIGTFTAAGVELDTSVSAIKGIANLAAVSGSTSQQASTAMYQLSQALAAGKVSLQDWNSVVNAGMGGEIFQEELKRTARVMGTGVDEAIEKYGSFRESLTKGAWLTTEVLTATLEKFTGDLTQEALLAQGYTAEQAADIIALGELANNAATEVKTFSQLMDTLKEAAQSGWTLTWQTLIGDFEEAKKLFTQISDTLGGIIGASAEARNNVLIGWKELGGRDDLLNGMKNIWESLYGVISAVGNAFREVFPRKTSEELHGFTKGFLELTEKMKPTEKTIESVKIAFKGLFSIVEVFTTLITFPLKFIPALTDVFVALGSGVSKVAGFFGTLTTGIIDFTSSGDFVSKMLDKIVELVTKGTSAIRDFVTNFNMPLNVDEIKEAVPAFAVISESATTAKDKILEFGSNAIQTFKDVDKEAIKIKTIEVLNTAMNFIVSMYDTLKNKTSDVLNFGKSVMDSALANMKKFIEWVDWKQVFEFLTGAVAAKFFLTLASVMKKLANAFETVAGNTSILKDIGESVTGAFDAIGDSLKTWQNSLRANNLMKIGLAIGVISASIWTLSKIDVDKLIPAVAAVSAMFVSLTASSILIDHFAEGGALKGLMGMGAAILLLSKSVEILAAIDPVKMAIGIGGILTLITALGVYTGVMSKMEAQITTGAMVLIAFSTAILILTAAVLQLTDIPATDLAIAMSGIIALSLAVSASAKILGKSKKDETKGALTLMAFASSVKILAKAVKILGGMDYTQMLQGLSGVGVIMATIAMFNYVIEPKNLISAAIAMNILAVAMTAMIVPITVLGNMDLKVLGVGLGTIALMLMSISVAMDNMPKNMPSIGFGLTMVAGSLVVMSGAMAILGNLEWMTINKALFGFGIALAGLSIALNSMEGTLPASAALLVASTALIALAGAVGLMGAFPWQVVALGLVGFAGALGILSIAMNSMILAAPALLSTAAFMLAFSTSLLISSAAIGVLGVALVGLAGGITALGALGVAVITTVKSLALAFLEAAPIIATAAADLIVAFIQGLSKGKNALRQAMVDLILTSLNAIREVIPALAQTVFEVIDKTLSTVAKHIEPIVKNVVKIIIGVIRGISTHLPELVTEAVNLVVALFASVTDALSQVNFGDLMKVVIGAGLMTGIVGVLSLVLPLIPSAAATLALMGGLILEMIGILGLIGGIAQIPGLKWLMTEGGEALELVGKAIGRFAGGLIGGIAQGVMSVLPSFGTYLGEFMTNAKPFFDGMKQVDSSLVTSMAALAGAVAIITATSFVDGIISFFRGGESSLVKFGKQLAEFAPYYRSYANIMSGTNGDELVKSSNAVKAIGEFVKMIPSQSGLSKLLLGDKNLVEFGKSLADFGPYFAQYARVIAGVNPESITASSNAAKTLAEFAKVVPNQGGLAALLVGDNSLADFGAGLAEFGPHLKKYSDSVKGVDATVVTNSVNAATAIAKFADIIPNKGGLVALLTGDNSLSSLAKDLAKFGPSLSDYSESVRNVSLPAVSASVTASKKLTELAEIIPAGKIRLSVLGDELEDFGKSFSRYFEKIAKIDNAVVVNSIDSINKLIAMANSMDKVNTYSIGEFTEGLSKIGSDGVTKFLKAFDGAHDKARLSINAFIDAAIGSTKNKSVDMSSAGTSMMNSLLSSITTGGPAVTSAMISIISSLSTTVQNGMVNIRSNMVSLMDVLTITIQHKAPAAVYSMNDLMNQMANAVRAQCANMSQAGISLASSIANGMNTGRSYLASSATLACSSIIGKLREYNNSFYSAGGVLMMNLTNGMRSYNNTVVASISSMLNSVRSNIVSKGEQYRTAGLSLMNSLTNGIRSGSSTVAAAAKTSADSGYSSIRGTYWSWYYSGKYLVEGFAVGIADYTYIATSRASSMASSAVTAAKNKLQIHSPSRVGGEIGMYFVQGFANGIEDNMSESTDRSATMADKARSVLADTLSNMSEIIDDDMSYAPVITPVLDMSNIESGQKSLDTLFSANMAGQMAYGMNMRTVGVNGVTTTNTTNNSNTIQNTFNITGSNANDIAEEVSRVIQRQVERRDAVWA